MTRKGRGSRRIAGRWRLAGPAAAFLLAACSAGPAGSLTSPGASPPGSLASRAPEATAQPSHRSYGPDFPAKAPGGALVRIDHGAFLSRDRRTLTIDFTGGPPYTRSNPCASDYEGWAGIDGDELVVQVDPILHLDHETLPPNVDCTMEGYGYVFELHLPTPFMGSAVRDRASGPIWVAPPERVAELAQVPASWELFQIYSSGASTSEPHSLARGYGPGPGVPGNKGQFLFLAQVFDGTVDHEIQVPIESAVVHGQTVTVGRNGDAGFIVNWIDGTDGMTLSSDDPALTLDGFIAIANGVAIPAP